MDVDNVQVRIHEEIFSLGEVMINYSKVRGHPS